MQLSRCHQGAVQVQALWSNDKLVQSGLGEWRTWKSLHWYNNGVNDLLAQPF